MSLPIQNPLTQSCVQKLFDYRDGNLYWRVKSSSRVSIGAKAGFTQGNGYRGVVINKKIYALHRIIFLYHYGYQPKVVDHIDGNMLNNRAENLRPATHSENGCNARINKTNTSGVKNVSWSATAKKWTVMIQKQKVPHYFGRYTTLAEAQAVALRERNRLHGTFARNY